MMDKLRFFPTFWVFLFAALLGALPSCQHAPRPEYADSPAIVAKRTQLGADLLRLLPEAQRCLPAARQEARWLADTAYKGAASIARINDPVLYCWFNNIMVNSTHDLQERGLCWHYEHDMYRELRRRPLHFFRIGSCVCAKGEGAEHHCVYLAAKDGVWPKAYILDAWRNNGRLKVMDEEVILDKGWEDDPRSCEFLAAVYQEGHRFPIEHWARVKTGRKWNEYANSWTPEGASSRQGQLMKRAMEEGLRQRNGRLTDYGE